MKWRYWVLGASSLAIALLPAMAAGQVAPTGGHYAARSSDTGFAGAANSSGGYEASVPLDMPAVRGGLPIPLQINYSERGVGAAGLGWDTPLSFIRRDTTFAHRRPIAATGVTPQPREQISLVLEGRRMDLVRTATGWVPRRDAPDILVREQLDGSWVMFDGQGRTYRFAATAAMAGTGMWLLQDVTGAGGNNVHLDYAITTPSIPGGTGLAIDLTGVNYNSHPTTAGCYKNSISLTYGTDAATPWSMAMVGTKIITRKHTHDGRRRRQRELHQQPSASAAISAQLRARYGHAATATAVGPDVWPRWHRRGDHGTPRCDLYIRCDHEPQWTHVRRR